MKKSNISSSLLFIFFHSFICSFIHSHSLQAVSELFPMMLLRKWFLTPSPWFDLGAFLSPFEYLSASVTSIDVVYHSFHYSIIIIPSSFYHHSIIIIPSSSFHHHSNLINPSSSFFTSSATRRNSDWTISDSFTTFPTIWSRCCFSSVSWSCSLYISALWFSNWDWREMIRLSFSSRRDSVFSWSRSLFYINQEIFGNR